jgi:trimethylamine--corrinoid protein Co-methyltransferase
MLGAINRTVRGIEVNDETLSIDVMRDVCTNGPGHFLGHGQTLGLMEKEYVYPVVGDRGSPKEWVEQGSTDVLQRARLRVAEILREHYPSHVSEAMDAQLRKMSAIKLPRENMRPGNGRW